MKETYEFDPCILDGSHKLPDIDDSVTLDTWKPIPKNKTFRVPSQWRKEYVKKNLIQPDNDDIKKIRAHLKSGSMNDEICSIFGITNETIEAIKNNLYDPVEGIFDNRVDMLAKKISKQHDEINEVREMLRALMKFHRLDYDLCLKELKLKPQRKNIKKSKKIEEEEE